MPKVPWQLKIKQRSWKWPRWQCCIGPFHNKIRRRRYRRLPSNRHQCKMTRKSDPLTWCRHWLFRRISYSSHCMILCSRCLPRHQIRPNNRCWWRRSRKSKSNNRKLELPQRRMRVLSKRRGWNSCWLRKIRVFYLKMRGWGSRLRFTTAERLKCL